MKHVFLKSTAMISVLIGTATAAYGIGNKVFIGQVGDTNETSIVQEGVDNLVGDDILTQAVVQDGNDNDVDILQDGANNHVGAEPGVANPTGVLGVLQKGDLSKLNIRQYNGTSTGKNTVNSIFQNVITNTGFTNNILDILQTTENKTTGLASGFDGIHFIGDVVQIQDNSSAAAGLANSATIKQFDGGSGLGVGNTITYVEQDGFRNVFNIEQRVNSNNIASARQFGEFNRATITQATNTGNVINTVSQLGFDNEMLVDQQGEDNLIDIIWQDNASTTVDGNMLTVFIEGQRNGRDAAGTGTGGFDGTKAASGVSVAQAAFYQYGDHNILNYSTTSSSYNNLYGFVQDGGGDFISGTVNGHHNETASFQLGVGNVLTFTVAGDTNNIAVSYTGDDNLLHIDQKQNNNSVDVVFAGSVTPLTNSNQNNDTALGGFNFTGTVFASTAISLTPGDIIQDGVYNLSKVNLNYGNQNKFATFQKGNFNVAEATIIGGFGQSVVTQFGDFNTSIHTQSGKGNNLVVNQ